MTKLIGLSILAGAYYSFFRWIGIAHSHGGVWGLTFLLAIVSVVAIVIGQFLCDYWDWMMPSWKNKYRGLEKTRVVAMYIFFLGGVVLLSPFASMIFEAPATVFRVSSWLIMLASAALVFVLES